METIAEILWKPTREDIHHSRLHEYRQWLLKNHGLEFPDYESLWAWSVSNLELFWTTIISFFNVKFHTPYEKVIGEDPMPDTVWCEGGTLNYAEHVYQGMRDQKMAILFCNERKDYREIDVHTLWSEVAKFRHYYIQHGVGPGDRIAGYLPNIPEATYAFLAAASIGAIWSCCSPDFGVSSVTDRFSQIEPVLLIVADGYYYNGKTHDRQGQVEEIRKRLPSLRNTLWVSYVHEDVPVTEEGITRLDQLERTSSADMDFDPVSFQHPLWILYSSGTTGAPKAITHSHGGCLLEHLKYLAFHNDVHPGERFFWYTTTGWMMWNFLHASMLLGSTIILYDGSPAYPDLNVLWEVAHDTRMNHFGTSAPFIVACMREGITPGTTLDLSGLRSMGSTGSPLPPEGFAWVYTSVHPRIWLCSMSGGTDVCTAFVGGVIEKNVRKGEIQARGLGCSLYAYNDMLQPVVGEVGEMVITKPMPSMPVYFWNDPDKKKYKASYFEDIPDVWRHGDWVSITKHGGIIILGRSDATLNRHGVRIGTAEIYRVMNDVPEITDSLIVNLELTGGQHFMPLFVKMKDGKDLTPELISQIGRMLKEQCSPRHVPDKVIIVPDIPYTISGKKMEAPVKKILMGIDVSKSLNPDAMRNPESLAFYLNFKIPD